MRIKSVKFGEYGIPVRLGERSSTNRVKPGKGEKKKENAQYPMDRKVKIKIRKNKKHRKR